MTRILIRFFILLSTVMSTGLACANGSPVMVSHEVTGQSDQGKVTTVDLLVHVKNPGEKAISNLELLFVPKSPVIAKRITKNIATLGPRQSADFPLQLQIPAFAIKDKATTNLLFWAGKYDNDEGQPVEFPVTSRTGGSR